jgi:hypothetical protein
MSRIFEICFFFHIAIPTRLLIHALKYFRISLRIRRDMYKWIMCWPRAKRNTAGFFKEFVCRAMRHAGDHELMIPSMPQSTRSKWHSSGSLGQTLEPGCMTNQWSKNWSYVIFLTKHSLNKIYLKNRELPNDELCLRAMLWLAWDQTLQTSFSVNLKQNSKIYYGLVWGL